MQLEPKSSDSNSNDNAVHCISFDDEKGLEHLNERSFRQQTSAFLIFEFGVLFHSIIIGVTLGSAGLEFSALYPVVVFHQSFEGLGLGTRLSAIPFPEHLQWMPWCLCAGCGLTTPIAIAGGLGVRTTYNPGSFTASIVSGVQYWILSQLGFYCTPGTLKCSLETSCSIRIGQRTTSSSFLWSSASFLAPVSWLCSTNGPD